MVQQGGRHDGEEDAPYDESVRLAAAAPTYEELLADVSQLESELAARNEELELAYAEIAERETERVETFENAPFGYLRLDRSGLIRDVNVTACTLLDRRRQHLIGKPMTALASEGGIKAMVDHLTAARLARGFNAPPQVVELDVRRPDGEMIPVVLYTHRLAGSDQLRTAMLDLRERRAAEEQAARLQVQERAARAASEAKDHFLAVLSHELRTPLTPVLAAVSELAARADDLPPELREVVEMIRRNVSIETRLIDDLLDLTRVARDKLHLRPEVLDAHALLTDVAAMLRDEAERAGVTLWLDLASHRWTVEADPTRLRQILWNLLKNAIKFTNSRGRVVLQTSNDAEGGLRVVVRDTGVGMSRQEVEQLFTPFGQGEAGRTRGGLGLGLALSKRLAEAHGGTLTAFSPGPGHGATFTLKLPTTARQPTAPPPPKPQVNGTPLRRRRILLVEDHPDTARVLARLLKKRGHQVTCAHGVGEAIQTAAADPDAYDLLLSDFGLPDGNGLEIMRHWHLLWGPIDGVILSGYGSDEDLARSREAGFRTHIVKPVDFEQLLEAVER